MEKIICRQSGRSALNFSFTLPEFLIEQNRLLPDLSYFFSRYYYMLFDRIGINIHIGIGNDFIKTIHSISNRFILFMANV